MCFEEGPGLTGGTREVGEEILYRMGWGGNSGGAGERGREGREAEVVLGTLDDFDHSDKENSADVEGC